MPKEAVLWEKLEGGALHCLLCAHNCRITNNMFGICGMRQNIDGILYTYAYGKVVAAHIDPIEKKPLYHFLPGTHSYSIATFGCNFRCAFCQNWTISQANAKDGASGGEEMSPEEIVRHAVREGCRSISYTYTEPTIFFEYAYDTAKIARKHNLKNIFVTNGFMTKEAIGMIRPYLDAANIDLKFFSDASYKRICGARLEPVLESIREMKRLGIWVEVTTLVVPGENDSDAELKDIAEFIAGVGSDVPWHVSRFHPDYEYITAPPTPIKTLENALEIGKRAGLKYVYPGNIAQGGDTVCASCGSLLIERIGFRTHTFKEIFTDGKCRKCGTRVEGVWGE